MTTPRFSKKVYRAIGEILHRYCTHDGKVVGFGAKKPDAGLTAGLKGEREMDLGAFLKRCDLELHAQDGMQFIPVEDAHYAITFRKFLEIEFPGYTFLTQYWSVWGPVIAVIPPQEAERKEQAATGPWQMHNTQPRLIERERVPAFVDELDMQLSIMIGESILDSREKDEHIPG